MPVLMTRPRRPRPVAILALAVLVAAATQVSSASHGAAPPTTLDVPPVEITTGDVPAVGAGDLDRIRANIAFWSERSDAYPRDFVSHTRRAAAEVDLARVTGDVTRYEAAAAALDEALAANPEYGPALGYRGAVLVALHEFDAARSHARAVLANRPGDLAALAVLGDASLALGDMDAARGAYEQLALVANTAATRVRRSHLAFVDGDPAGAVEASRAAVDAAIDEGLEGAALAWFRSQLGDTLASTGDLDGAADAFAAALRDDPGSALARWGLARVAAAAERWDEAIAHLDRAIATIPSPEFLARRADLYRLRGADGDGRRERDDRRTVLAIAGLRSAAAGVYDRTLSLYLASNGEDPARALELAESELTARRDIYGYDALAWALLANDRAEEARVAMTEALALGTRDSKLLYHAGMIEARLGHAAAARTFLEDALRTDPSFDPVAVRAARATLAGLS